MRMYFNAGRTAAILLTAFSGLVLGGCDPGLPDDELPAGELSELLRAGDQGAAPAEGCEQLVAAAGSSYQTVPHPTRPGLVIVERDGEPACVDTAEAVAQRAARLNLNLQMTTISIPVPHVMPSGGPGGDQVAQTASQPVRPGQGTRSTSTGDDPIPVGRTARTLEANSDR